MEAARDSLSEQDVSHDTSLALDASVRIRFPSDSQLLSKLYSNHGIRVRMIRRTRPPKIPTVRELINQLAKKHEKLLMKEMNEGSAKSVSTTQAESSSSTPTAPYSTADILYNNEVSHSQQEDLRQSSFTDSEKNQELVSHQKSKEIDNPNNRRPSSKSGSRKSLSIETVTFDREDSSKSSTLPPPKGANHFRPNGIRNNVLKGEPLFNTRSTVAVSSSGREADDLIAMGTLWSPNQTSASLLSHHQSQSQSTLHPGTQPPHHQRSSYTSTMSAGLVNISNSLSSKSLSLNTTMQPPMSTASTSMTLQRKYVSNGIRPIMVQNNLSGLRSIKEKKEEEAKYSDPLVGATPQFLQRIQELQALEGETIRWERTKKLKKKKQDRDS